MRTRTITALAAFGLLVGLTLFGPAGLSRANANATAGTPAVLNVAQVDQQDVATRNGCEGDTLVEPDVAVSPVNPQVAVAASHDCRFYNGGALDISYAWTSDGGQHWSHGPVPGLTKAVGGVWDRASDPVVGYGPDGTAYMSALVLNTRGCDTGVVVLRSMDGGRTWQSPVTAQSSSTCSYSDDKDWLAVDDGAHSAHRGRLYLFWTAFITRNGLTTSPQVLRYSDDGGLTWSATFQVNPTAANTQNSQPMIESDGAIVDTYLNYGPASAGNGPERPHAAGRPQSAGAPPQVQLSARTSSNGGRTWGPETVVAGPIGGGPANVRCCLPAAAIDPVTGKMFTVWEGFGPARTDPVELSWSVDGRTWSSPVRVSTGDVAGTQRVNSTVTAYAGKVFVSYGTRTDGADDGGFVQQQLSWSDNGGGRFAGPISLGPVSTLRWAAKAPVHFPGDYIGAAASASRLYLVWCRSSQPPSGSGLKFWQTLWESTLVP